MIRTIAPVLDKPRVDKRIDVVHQPLAPQPSAQPPVLQPNGQPQVRDQRQVQIRADADPALPVVINNMVVAVTRMDFVL